MKRFINFYDAAMIGIVILGSYALYRGQNNLATSAMGALFLLMAIEGLVKIEVKLRGRIVRKEENITLYVFVMSVYLIAAAMCLFFLFITY